MKKLLLTAALILTLPSICFASASLRVIKVNPDVLIDSQRVADLNGGSITLTKDYINQITAHERTNGKYVRFTLGDFTGHNYCPNLPASLHGKVGTVAYKTWSDEYKAWIKSAGSGPVADFQSDAVVINADYLVNRYQSSGRILDGKIGNCGLRGTYPSWRVLLDIEMSSAEYNTFKTDALVSGYSIIEVSPPVDDGTQ